MDDPLKARFFPVSLTCRRAAPSTLLSSSQQAGWTSVLLEHNRVRAEPTPSRSRRLRTRRSWSRRAVSSIWSRSAAGGGGTPTTAGITEPDTTVRLRRRVPADAATFDKVNLYIPRQLFLEVAEHHRRAGHRSHDRPLTSLAFENPFVPSVVLALQRAVAAGAQDIYAQSAAHVLVTHLLSSHSPWLNFGDDARDPGGISDRRLKRVLQYMRDHLSEPLTLDRLAEEAGISKFHFARLFSERTGVAPHAHLVRLRLECAAHLLTTTDLRIGEIARHCGFASAPHFGAIFSRRFGKSPIAFRRP